MGVIDEGGFLWGCLVPLAIGVVFIGISFLVTHNG